MGPWTGPEVRLHNRPDAATNRPLHTGLGADGHLNVPRTLAELHHEDWRSGNLCQDLRVVELELLATVNQHIRQIQECCRGEVPGVVLDPPQDPLQGV